MSSYEIPAQFAVGTAVAKLTGNYRARQITMGKVVKITPSGKQLTAEFTYASGRVDKVRYICSYTGRQEMTLTEYGHRGSYSNGSSLILATDERVDSITKEAAQQRAMSAVKQATAAFAIGQTATADDARTLIAELEKFIAATEK